MTTNVKQDKVSGMLAKAKTQGRIGSLNRAELGCMYARKCGSNEVIFVFTSMSGIRSKSPMGVDSITEQLHRFSQACAYIDKMKGTPTICVPVNVCGKKHWSRFLKVLEEMQHTKVNVYQLPSASRAIQTDFAV